jgi:hypothetical protein
MTRWASARLVARAVPFLALLTLLLFLPQGAAAYDVPYRDYYGGCYWWDLRAAPGGSITYDLSDYVPWWTQGVENWDSALGSLMEFNSVYYPNGQTHLRWEGQEPVYYYCDPDFSACYYIDDPWCTDTRLTEAAIYFDYIHYVNKSEVRRIAVSAHEWGHNLNLDERAMGPEGDAMCSTPYRIMGSDGGIDCMSGPSCPEQAAVLDFYWLLPWWHDRDGDCFDNDKEDFIGTDDWDDCPDNSSDDAWPPDFNNSRKVTSADLVLFRLNAQWLGRPYNARYDLNASGKVTSGDLVIFRQNYIGSGREICTG